MDAVKRKELYYNIVDYTVQEIQKLLEGGNLNSATCAVAGVPYAHSLMNQFPEDAGVIALLAEKAERAVKRTIELATERLKAKLEEE